MLDKKEKSLIKEILTLLPQSIGVTQIKQHSINNVKNQFQVSYMYQSSQRIPINQAFLFEEVSNKLKKFSLDKFICDYFLESIHPFYGKDDCFIGFPNLMLYEDGEIKVNQKLEVTPDILNVMIFWSITNWESVQLMKDLNTQIMNKLRDARILSINIDQDQEAWTQYILELENYNCYHFNPSHIAFNLQMKALQFTKFPHVVIVNKEQKVIVVENTSLEQITIILQKQSNNDNKQIIDQQIQEIQQQIVPTLNYSKDDYKIFKQKIQTEVLEMINAFFAEKDIVELKILQKKDYFKDGSKVVLDRSKILVSIDQSLENQSKELIKQFKNYLTEIFGEQNYIIIRKGFRKYETEEQVVIREILNDFVSQFEVQIIPYQWEKHAIKWKHQKQAFICKSKYEQRVKFDRDLSIKEYQEIIQGIAPILEAQDDKNSKLYLDTLIHQLKSIRTLGDKFQPLDGFYNKEAQEIIIQHQPQQMLVLIWLIPCVFIIIKLENFYQKLKEQYGEKLRFVYLGIEYNKEDIDLIYKFKPKCEFYYSKVIPTLAREKYEVNLFPFQMIIDQNGIIRQKGLFHQSEKKIAFEFATHPFKNQLTNKTINYNQLEEYLSNQKIITKEIGNQLQFIYELNVQTNQCQELIANCQYTIREKQLYNLRQFNQSLLFHIPSDKLSTEQRLILSMDIPYPGIQCHSCGQRLNKNLIQYYNYFKDVFYCGQCGEKKDKLNLNYEIKDNLVFINTPITDVNELKDIDIFRFGKNIQPLDNSTTDHKFNCNGCRKSTNLGKDRYIVLNNERGLYNPQGYSDFCTECFAKIKSKTPESKKFTDINDNSVFLRITCFFGYNNF
ncbi:unnamed protein product [Paramecium pentaurelia]|uniref:Thioredoxin-like fold domain-containing protein n=1 Tax=Paramecium pentaurelia TaxID=43138 RepID=A0A8S1V130_9CILI|nr:unnamed protein product [Paramecium pentaurelia]